MTAESSWLQEDVPTSLGATLPVIVAFTEDQATEQTMGIFSCNGRQLKVREIPVNILQKNLAEVVCALMPAFERITESSTVLKLKQAHVGLEITSKGGVQLIGTAEIAGKAAITVVFGE